MLKDNGKQKPSKQKTEKDIKCNLCGEWNINIGEEDYYIDGYIVTYICRFCNEEFQIKKKK